MWRLQGEPREARAVAEAAIEAGFTLFDTADIYGSGEGDRFGRAEALFGAVLREKPQLREQIILATKGGIVPGVPYDSSAAYLTRACEASLRRLGVETIDLYQIHRPDLLAHPAEVAATLDELRRAGKIREAGVSNHTAAQTEALTAHLPFPLASIQPELSALAIEALDDGVLDQAMARGLAVLAWSPLAQGRLAAHSPPTDARAERVVETLDAVAAANGASRAAVALAWVLAHPSRPFALVGTQTPARIREAATALDVTLTRAEWYAILVASRGGAPMP
jgi:aryl-alcohol dehydrogenase-like predicted oxidoreductase